MVIELCLKYDQQQPSVVEQRMPGTAVQTVHLLELLNNIIEQL